MQWNIDKLDVVRQGLEMKVQQEKSSYKKMILNSAIYRLKQIIIDLKSISND